ncbi:MAG: PorP/SprF family type IX secretion system membrane protein [Bacteroidia bacterium]
MKTINIKSVSVRAFFAAAVVAGSVTTATAQDFHLSQYDMAPLYYNPAQTGMYLTGNEPFRIFGNFRSQWQKLQGKPYSSVSVAGDMPIDRFGAGLLIMDHIAGTSNFGTFQFLASGAYKITSDNSRNHFLTAGLQMGFFQKRFNAGNLLFESQYTNDGLDGSLPSGEVFDRQSITRFDANIGIFYKYLDKNKLFDPSAGFAIYHLTMPNESFTGTKSQLPMRFTSTAACDIHATTDFIITPNVLFMYQRKAFELNMGVMTEYRVNNTPYRLMAGANYRHKDAVVFQLGLRQGSSMFRLSYDILTSRLKYFGGTRGAFEMGVVYTGQGKGKGRVRAGGI